MSDVMRTSNATISGPRGLPLMHVGLKFKTTSKYVSIYSPEIQQFDLLVQPIYFQSINSYTHLHTMLL